MDTSAWIDFINDIDSPARNLLVSALKDELAIAISPVIYQELLQGVKDDSVYNSYVQTFGSKDFLLPKDLIDFHLAAANIYRRCRKEGITLRSSIDCQIAQTAIEHKAPLLHSDRDFNRIASVIQELKIHGD